MDASHIQIGGRSHYLCSAGLQNGLIDALGACCGQKGSVAHEEEIKGELLQQHKVGVNYGLCMYVAHKCVWNLILQWS